MLERVADDKCHTLIRLRKSKIEAFVSQEQAFTKACSWSHLRNKLFESLLTLEPRSNTLIADAGRGKVDGIAGANPGTTRTLNSQIIERHLGHGQEVHWVQEAVVLLVVGDEGENGLGLAARAEITDKPELERPIRRDFVLTHVNSELVEEVQIQFAESVVHAKDRSDRFWLAGRRSRDIPKRWPNSAARHPTGAARRLGSVVSGDAHICAGVLGREARD